MITPLYSFGGMMTAATLDANNEILTAVEQKNRSEIGIYRGATRIDTVIGGPDADRLFAGYPDITCRGFQWTIAYQHGRRLRVSTESGAEQDFSGAYPIAYASKIRWFREYGIYVLAFTSQGQRWILHLDAALQVRFTFVEPMGNSRFAKVIYNDGRVEWDDQVKPVGGVHKARCYPCPDGHVTCVEWDDFSTRVYVDGTHILDVPPGKRPFSERTSKNALIVALTQGRIVKVATAPFDPPIDLPSSGDTVNLPHIPDDEFREVAATLEADYRDIHGGAERTTHVDQLGYGRWESDYLTARSRGESHAQALASMRRGYGVNPQ